MKQKFFLFSFFLLSCATMLAQSTATKSARTKKPFFVPGKTKPTLFGFSFSLSDFNQPRSFGANGNATSIPASSMSAGVGLNYWKGLKPFVDFSAKFNAVFHDYSSLYNNQSGKTEIGLEIEPNINYRPVKDENMFAPFLSGGFGLGLYTNRVGAYVPLGAGIQFNGSSETYLFLQAQYKISFTPKVLPDNMHYSIGFAQNVNNNDKPKVAPTPVIPPVVVKAPVVQAPPPPAVKDTDGDGVPDDVDACPTMKGTVAFKGCPDTDGDGIPDNLDKCPEMKGLSKYAGCPIPDTDGDGVTDEFDKCPSVAGSTANNGCPEIEKAVIEKINVATQNIFFESGSDKLMLNSSAALDAISAILKERSELKVNINGYADNTGDAQKNLALTQARANAVKKYLVDKGIDAARLTATGFGIENPIADNKTAEGRAKNRRVELKLSNN